MVGGAFLSRVGRGPVLIGVASVALLVGYVEVWAARAVTHGFVAYYAAARLLITGQLGPHVYDDKWFQVHVQQLTRSGVLEIFGPNPPTMALIAVPVAWIDHATARHVWLIASVGCLIAAMGALLLYADVTDGSRVPLIIIALLLLNPAVFANLRTGQAYLVVFALLTGAVLGLLRGRDRVAGAFLGLALALKSSGLALFVMLLARRRWTAVATATVIVLGCIVVVAALGDSRAWLAYLSYVPEFVARPAASTTAYQTTLGLFRRLCVADATWNPSPAANCGPLATLIPALMLGAALLVTIVLALRAPARLWVAAGVCLSELTLPVAAEQHFVLLGIPLVLLWPNRGSSRLLLGAAITLLLVPLDYTAHRFTEGWGALLAYPRLYAAWLVWVAAAMAMYRSRS